MTRRVVFAVLLAIGVPSLGCKSPAPAEGRSQSGDATFNALTQEVLQDFYKRNPINATYLGIHTYDDRLPDLTPAGISATVAAARAFRQRLDAIDPASLSLDARLDREFLQRQMDAIALQLEVVRSWAKDPDSYTTSITASVYTIMKRSFAPAAERLKLVIARENKMPAFLQQARANLQDAAKIFADIAIEQIEGNRAFFQNDLPLAFKDVTDAALVAQFQHSNGAAIAALDDYKVWLQKELLARATGPFALGADTYSKLLSATEMIDAPLDRLLVIAEADRNRNEAAFVQTAKTIDPRRTPEQVLLTVASRHPAPGVLLKTTQDPLDSLRQFITTNRIVTIPPSDPARVQETPPFMRSTTSASMDTPGPFEVKATEAYFNMTLPDLRWPKPRQDEFMRQWYFAAISNVSVHEVYPGHYLQFLYGKRFPTDTRKVFGANSNSEGWAHYAEQMMLDEGLHADDPTYRLAQLQDALLRDVRFIVGIKMHTQGMTVDTAEKLFETEGHQPPPVALAEAKRGAGDPLYGYYTMGKLGILKLRDDYKVKKGGGFTLQEFHDTFIQAGPLPLPLIRQRMLGESGNLF
jgi:uncharacterized protein (DUF885 family)